MCFFYSFFRISVPRVSTDGSPHEVLTLVACLSGAVVAIILVSIIIFMLRKATRNEFVMMQNIAKQVDESQRDIESQRKVSKSNTNPSKMKIFTIFGASKQSFDLN